MKANRNFSFFHYFLSARILGIVNFYARRTEREKDMKIVSRAVFGVLKFLVNSQRRYWMGVHSKEG